MDAESPKAWRYGPGTIRLTPSGTYAAFVALGHGKRRRAVLKTIAEAKAWILAGESRSGPDRMLVEDAMRARAILPPEVTLEEAARHWAATRRPGPGSVALGDAWAAYAAEAARLVRPRTMQGYRHALEGLVETLGSRAAVSAIGPDDIERAVSGRSPHARNNRLRAYGAFFSWCVDRGHCETNPAAKVRKARIAHGVPAVLSIDDGRRLLRLAAKIEPRSVALFALGMFAGLRPEEAVRVRPSNVVNGYVVLSGDITKTADARTVKIRPNLAAWLARYPVPARGCPEKGIKAVRKAFGKWAQDVARHSYATYAYEESGDAVRVASEMGHGGTEVFFRHYRALAAPGSGREWFRIRP
ncbi:MAG: hypothetical protein IKH04_13080 [Kiritimatiellae bacterium]|nr:hypothetical protein [Kiritimatiellia bacterium]